MIEYNRKLKERARRLRTQMTDSERALWERLRRKQVQGVQFYRQKPIGNYIVDFYAPKAKIVIEVDGSQHMESEQEARDLQRDAFLASKGLRVLRFDDLQVLKEIEGVMEVKSPLTPLLQRGEPIVTPPPRMIITTWLDLRRAPARTNRS